MKRVTPIVFVLLLIGGIGLLMAARADHRAAALRASSASASARAGGPAREHGPAAGDTTCPLDLDEPSGLGSSRVALDETNADAGGVLPDGGSVPDLEGESPKSVVFGIVLVQYADAQQAPPGTRSRADAEKLAAELAQLGKTDFKAAVDKGDPGSTVNAGRMFRGVLEPAPEYVLFKLGKNEVSDPVDTPRGFWVVKRIE